MTLYTSATEKTINRKRRFNRYAVFYLLFAAVCLTFSMFYEFYSHSVYSIHMRYLFLIPLLLGFVPCALTEYLKLPLPGRFWHDSVLVFTGGSCLQGIMEIYGTSSIYTKYMLYAGIGLVLMELALRCYTRSTVTISQRMKEFMQ